MKLKEKTYSYEYYFDCKKKEVLNLVKLSIDFMNNKESMNTKDLYKLICHFYDMEIEIYDYLEYVNRKYERKFYKIIEIPIDKVTIDSGSEGHGRDFSWWTQNYQRMIKAFSNKFTPLKEEYTIEEVKELIKEGEIYPVYPFGRKTKKKANNIKDDIKYLLSYQSKDLSCDDEYFDYIVYSLLEKIKIKNLLEKIRVFITTLKLNSVLDPDKYYNEIETYEEEADMLISVFNNVNNGKGIQNTALEIVLEYLRNLPNVENLYEEISIDQIINVFSVLDYEKDKQLCDEIQNLVISLGEDELCYMMAANIDWVDKKKMGEIVIKSGNPDMNYYFMTDVDGADIEKHKEVILNSEFTDDYILERIKK